MQQPYFLQAAGNKTNTPGAVLRYSNANPILRGLSGRKLTIKTTSNGEERVQSYEELDDITAVSIVADAGTNVYITGEIGYLMFATTEESAKINSIETLIRVSIQGSTINTFVLRGCTLLNTLDIAAADNLIDVDTDICTSLKVITIAYDYTKKIIDYSNYPNLETVNLGIVPYIEKLDLSANNKLHDFMSELCTNLSEVILTQPTKAEITTFNVSGAKITAADFTGFSSLNTLELISCYYITDLYIKDCIALNDLDITDSLGIKRITLPNTDNAGIAQKLSEFISNTATGGEIHIEQSAGIYQTLNTAVTSTNGRWEIIPE